VATSERILERIVRKLGVPDLLDRLVDDLSPTDLQSLLLEVYRRRAARISVRQLNEQYTANRFVKPAAADPRHVAELDQLAYGLLPPGFDALELSPLCPLGTNGVVATVDQNKVVSTARNTEVVSDSTNVMALECASRRAQASDRMAWVRLCASHRLVRAQGFQGPLSYAHFRIFGLCTAGRDQGSFRFECESLQEQVSFWLRFVRALPGLGLDLGEPRLLVRCYGDDALRARLDEGVFDPLDVPVEADPQSERALGYYTSCAVRMLVAKDGREVELMDGGFTPWTQTLRGDRKERLLISGMGMERVAVLLGEARA
jgi:hypothetical protein